MTLFKSWKLALITYILEFDQKYHSYCILMTQTHTHKLLLWYRNTKRQEKNALKQTSKAETYEVDSVII